jgi:hypothetical protein
VNTVRHVRALDGVDATCVGVLLGATGTRDIADAHVVVCARRAAQAIVTSDPDDLLRLDPWASLVRIGAFRGERESAVVRALGPHYDALMDSPRNRQAQHGPGSHTVGNRSSPNMRRLCPRKPRTTMKCPDHCPRNR